MVGTDVSADTSMGLVRVPTSVRITAAVIAVAMTVHTSLRHAFFLSGTFDLAFYVQDVWAIAHGIWANTVSGFHVFADHFSPVLLVLAPLGFFQTAYGLLAVQGLVVASGVFPAYRLGRAHGGHELGVLVALWYGASAAVWHAVVFDFHPVTLGVPILLWLVAGVEEGRAASHLIGLSLLGALIREDIAILVGIVLLTAAWRRRSRRLAAAAGLVAAVGFIYIGWITVWPGGMGGYHFWTRFGGGGGEGLVEKAVGAVRGLGRPDVLVALAVTMVPLLVIPPIRGWRQSWPALVMMAGNFVASYGAQASIYYQYFAPVVPFLIWGSARYLGQHPLPASRQRLARLATLSVFLVFGPVVYLGYGLPDRFLTTFPTSAGRAELSEVLDEIPPRAAVSASNHLLPHLATRAKAYPFPGPMVCAQSLIFHVDETSYADYVVVEWDAFPETDLRAVITSWGYTLEKENHLAGRFVRTGPNPVSVPCPTVAEERAIFTSGEAGS